MIRAHTAGVILSVRAQPGARKSAVIGRYGEAEQAQLKIAVHAPAREGRANEALITFVADCFDLPKTAVELVAGASSRSKLLLLRGVSVKAAEEAIARLLAEKAGNNI